MTASASLEDLVQAMEGEIRDIARWGGALMDLSSDQKDVRPATLFIIGQAIHALGASIEAQWEKAHEASCDRVEAPVPSAEIAFVDILRGARSIAAYLGVPKGVARHLIRTRQIPWFDLGGVACARRSTLAAHFSALEAERRP